MTGPEAEAYLSKVAAELYEHFDAVQIMVAWNEDAQSMCTKRGCGLWQARQGMAHEFIHEDQAQEIANRTAAATKPPPDETEDWKGA